MARFYSNENFPLPVVEELRRLGDDVLTSLDAGNANQRIADAEVLRFASQETRILLTLNRRHFVALHQKTRASHHGIMVCAFDPDFVGQARRIHQTVTDSPALAGQLFRVNRPG